MNPLSRFEVEQICETVYYQALDVMSRYDYVDTSYEFQNLVEEDFKSWSYPKFNWKIQDYDKPIVYKWQQKIRAAAKEWYDANVIKKKEEGKREQEREQRQKYEAQCRCEEEQRQRQEEQRRLKENEVRRKAEEEAEKARIRSEEARLKAEAAARRKAQEEANRRQLERLQAQWRGGQNPQSSSPATNSAGIAKTATGVSCPQCGNPVSSTAKFCTSCGTKLSVTCSSCGTTLKSTAKFCTSCGNPVNNN